MTHRIGFRFEPRRGFWRVVANHAVPESPPSAWIDVTPVFTVDGLLYVLSPEPVHLGAFRSPKSVLESYLNKPRSK